jgi:vancomycin resistance protein YoaR
MKVLSWFAAASSCAVIICAGLLALAPYAFAGRVLPGVHVAGVMFTGMPKADLAGAIAAVNDGLANQSLALTLRGQTYAVSFAEAGVTVDTAAASRHIQAQQAAWPVSLLQPDSAPVAIDSRVLRQSVQQRIGGQLHLPVDATLAVAADNSLQLVPAQDGEGIDWQQLQQDISARVGKAQQPISLNVVPAQADIQNGEVEAAKQLAQDLLRNGFTLHYDDQAVVMKPFTIRRLLKFAPQADPKTPDNTILGVVFDDAGLQDYLKTTLEPDIDKPAENARFELADGTVRQFAMPEKGKQLDMPSTVSAINDQLARGANEATLAISTVEPEISELADMHSLGINEMIARGETDFRGSPKNRIHNITVGTQRYQGLLIAPGAEFSFDSFLGPVDGEHGFLPELVIKDHLTTPEFGGGLCQVSTTAFRAAVQAGLKITARRNHAYAVRYYGPPGFDATIYPPYTDLRFLNNTPGYILIQTKIEGTKLSFEFWGTNDGRQVAIDGPTQYDRQANGAVKAILKQKVVKDGQVVFEDTFYSNYKSPDLFPHAVVNNGETPPSPT